MAGFLRILKSWLVIQLDLPWGCWSQFCWSLSKLVLGLTTKQKENNCVSRLMSVCAPSPILILSSQQRHSQRWLSWTGQPQMQQFYNLIISFFVTYPSLPSQISFSGRFANDSYCSVFSLYCWIILFVSLLLDLRERLKSCFGKKKKKKRSLILLSKQATKEKNLKEAEAKRCMLATRLGRAHQPCYCHDFKILLRFYP